MASSHTLLMAKVAVTTALVAAAAPTPRLSLEPVSLHDVRLLDEATFERVANFELLPNESACSLLVLRSDGGSDVGVGMGAGGAALSHSTTSGVSVPAVRVTGSSAPPAHQ